ALDPGPIIPGPVEQDDLARGRQLRHVTLEVPLRPLPVARYPERHGAHDAVVGPFGDPLDHTALTGSVTALEQHHQPVARLLHPVLELDELDLEAHKFGLVDLLLQPALRAVRVGTEGTDVDLHHERRSSSSRTRPYARRDDRSCLLLADDLEDLEH